MKPLLAVFVLIWYICVNENYLFTTADPRYFTSTFEYGIRPTISCEKSVIYIEHITIKDIETTCQLSKQCDATENMTNNIKTVCDGFSSCILEIQLLPTCLKDNRYLNITFHCSVRNMACNFEKSIKTCHWKLSEGWKRINGSESVDRTLPQTDVTTGSDYGHYLYTGNFDPHTLKSGPMFSRGQWKCLTFWYNINSSNSVLKVYQDLKVKTIRENAQNWTRVEIDLVPDDVYDIVIKALPFMEEYIALDDIYLHHGPCNDFHNETSFETGLGGWETNDWIRQKAENRSSQMQPSTDYTTASRDEFNERMCVDTTDENNIECSTETLDFDNINVKIDPKLDKIGDQCKDTEHNIQKKINEVCVKNKTCILKPTDFISQYNKHCLLFNRSIVFHLNYSCRDETTSMSSTISARTETKDVSDRVSTQIPASTHGSQETTYNGNQSKSSNQSLTIGVTVGVVLVILVAACLILGIIYLRRSRYLEKKAPSNIGNANNHIDYTGHQNIAFSPKVSGNTQTDYCEIRASKHNEQYHDISDTFSPLINTEKDVKYSEIANVVNSPNSSLNPSTNYQHQYITLDPNATGFNRSNPQTNLHNESKNNLNSNEKTSLTCGDDYAVLDPDDLNESKNITPNVLPFSDNYVVLDPNETGFNRQENTDRVCNYDLATPIVTSEDPYDVSKDETYDTSSNSRHKEKENNIYSHTVDNVYDTAVNQRKKEESDGTYDHFFG